MVHFTDHCINMGMNMIHISDDWGFQYDILLLPNLWQEIIHPNLKQVVDYVHSKGCFVSLHTDDIQNLCDKIVDLGIDAVNPCQEYKSSSYVL